MQRDPTVVGRTNVVAETFAGVINSFVDPISWKTMASDQGVQSSCSCVANSAIRDSPSSRSVSSSFSPTRHCGTYEARCRNRIPRRRCITTLFHSRG
jgi:hypothetical protein